MLTSVNLPAVNLPNTSTTFVPLTGAKARITIAEERMILDLNFLGVYNHDQATGETKLTFFIDGVDVALPFTDGIVASGRSLANTPFHIDLHHKCELSKGEHELEIRWKTNVGQAPLLGAVDPAALDIELRSHVNTLAQGTNSKVQGIY